MEHNWFYFFVNWVFIPIGDQYFFMRDAARSCHVFSRQPAGHHRVIMVLHSPTQLIKSHTDLSYKILWYLICKYVAYVTTCVWRRLGLVKETCGPAEGPGKLPRLRPPRGWASPQTGHSQRSRPGSCQPNIFHGYFQLKQKKNFSH